MTELRARPEAAEYPSFYAGYVASVPDGDITDVLQTASTDLNASLASIPEASGAHAYAEGKWTVRTVIGHMIDAERIFSYRLLRIARGDATPLPGFEENGFALTAESDSRSVAELAGEMAAVRASTLALLASLPDAAWARSGTVNNAHVSVRALAYITTGHALHHLNVLRERYGVARA
ncbi:MAG: DinB family protein [Gemmatimonadota bacterium]